MPARWMVPDEAELLAYCRRLGATHLLVPTNRKLAYAGEAGVEYGDYFGAGRPTAKGRRTTLFRLMYFPGELRGFQELHRNGSFVLYALRGN